MKDFPIELIRDACDGEPDNIRPDGYSGRGMYGTTCASISFDGMADAFIFFARLGLRVGAEVAEEADSAHLIDWEELLTGLMNRASTDSMGLGIVAYFPGWVFV